VLIAKAHVRPARRPVVLPAPPDPPRRGWLTLLLGIAIGLLCAAGLWFAWSNGRGEAPSILTRFASQAGLDTTLLEGEPTAPERQEKAPAARPAPPPPKIENPVLDKKLRPAPPRSTRTLVHRGAWARGSTAFARARQRQTTEKVAVLLYVGVKWCGYCREFEGKVMRAPSVLTALGPVLKVHIDPDKSSGDKALARKYGVRSFPTLLLFATSDDKPKKIGSGGSNPKAFIDNAESNIIYGWHMAGSNAFDKGRFDDAIEWADQVLAMRPADPGGKVLHLRALAFHKQEKHRDALRDFALACGAGHQGDCQYLMKRR
jgi:thiol-disulfide isomerase/thioredoxin